MNAEKEIDIKVYLKDMAVAIQEIFDFLPEERNFYVFEKDLKTRKAVERNMEIIGEAMNRVLKNNPDIQIDNSRKIVDTRNRIIHRYDSVSVDTLWLIICNYLPKLQQQVNELLES